MDYEQLLQRAAENYRVQGYSVVVRPGPEDLPDFAKDFQIEILARRADGNVLASAKKNRTALQDDPALPTYAEVTGRQPGWRYDLMVLMSEVRPRPPQIEAADLTNEEVERVLDEVERLRGAGFERPAFLEAWSVLETAMRKRLLAEGEEAAGESSPLNLLGELYAGGMLWASDFHQLEGLVPARDAIVHGFASPTLGEDTIPLLIRVTRELLDEANEVVKIA